MLPESQDSAETASPTSPPSKMTVQNGYHPKQVVWLFDGRPGAKQSSGETVSPTPSTSTSLFGTALNSTAGAMTATMDTTVEVPEVEIEVPEVEVEVPEVEVVLPQELSDWLISVHLEQYGRELFNAGFDSLLALATITDADRDDLKVKDPYSISLSLPSAPYIYEVRSLCL